MNEKTYLVTITMISGNEYNTYIKTEATGEDLELKFYDHFLKDGGTLRIDRGVNAVYLKTSNVESINVQDKEHDE